jgi:hypothetical protein
VIEGDKMRAVPRTVRDIGRLAMLVLPLLALLSALLVAGALPARADDGGSTPTGSAVSISLIPATSSALPSAPVTGDGGAVETAESVRISLIPATSSAIAPTTQAARHAQPTQPTQPAPATEPAGPTEPAQATVSAPAPAADTEGVQRSAPASLGSRSGSDTRPAVDSPLPTNSVSISLIPATSSAIPAPTAVAGAGSASPSGEPVAGDPVRGSGSPSSARARDLRVSLAVAEAAAGQAPGAVPVATTEATAGDGSDAWLLIGAALLVLAGGVGIVLARLQGRRRTGARRNSG